MKANELRIGNWIEAYFQHIRVSQTTFTKQIEDFKPIPLTKEWLIRFGFEEYGNGWHNGLIWYVNNKCWFGKSPIIENIKYVHQLQNLYFALTGEELTIK